MGLLLRYQRFWLVALCAAWAMACPSVDALSDAGTPPTNEVMCPPSFVPSDSGVGCDPLFGENCSPGTMPVLGTAECRPVGWHNCPQGFEPAVDGWGCVDIQPTQLCVGATMERLGYPTCQPVGDCDAFPPVAATLFVDDSFAAQDATHFLTINAALAAAPAGATIAVDEGTYTESLVLTRPVTVVGRCAERVHVRNPAGGLPPGVVVNGALTAEVSGLTLRDFIIGAGAGGKGQLTIRNMVIISSRDFGIYAVDPGSVLRVHDSVIRDSTATASALGHGGQVEAGGVLELARVTLANHNAVGLYASGKGSKIVADQVVVRDTRATSTGFGGMGMVAETGTDVRLTRSAIVGNRHRGITVHEALLHLEESIVRDTQPKPDGANGDGVSGFGATIVLDRVSLRGNTTAGIHVQDGSQLNVVASSVWGTHTALEPAVGLNASLSSVMNLVSTAVVNNIEFPVAYFHSRGTIESSLVADSQQGPNDGARAVSVTSACVDINDSALINNAMGGIVIVDSADAGCETTLNRTLIANTRTRDDGVSGRGLSIHSSAVRLVDSVVTDNHETGAWVSRGARLVMQGGTIRSTHPQPDGLYGYGLVARTGAVVELTGVDVRSSHGIGLALANATGVVVGGHFALNGIALDVREGTQLRAEGDAGTVLGTLFISPETQFIDNGARLGTGTLPLPDVEF